jgi:hypothetical protein
MGRMIRRNKSAKCAISVIAILASGCATYQTFNDVPPDQLNSSTLHPGDELQLEYSDGSLTKFTVDALTEDTIISMDGEHWPKAGIKKLTIKIASNSSDCGSLASWRNGRWWKEEAKNEIEKVFY